MKSVILFCLLISPLLCYGSIYNVTATRLNNQMPIINGSNPDGTSGASIFQYNYNVAFVPGYNGLLVRAQNSSTAGPYSVKPSHIAYAQLEGEWWSDLENIQVDPILEQSVVIEPYSIETNYGTEDPRIALDESTGIYYLLYSAVQNFTTGPPKVVSKLSLAASMTPEIKSSWKFYGDIFPQISWSKSGALLIIPGETSYLFWGDSTLVPGIQMATTKDLINYEYIDDIFIHTRNDSFDSGLCEAGPMPLKLSDGNYLFLYNSGRHGYPSPKPGYDFQYNVGWVVLNGSDPTQILQRSEEPILSPELDWETGTNETFVLTPNVVFVEGWSKGVEENTFIAFYGAGDSYVGVAQITVEISDD